MDDISLKYSLLDKSAREEIRDFIDFLIAKKKVAKKSVLSSYKKKILKVSTWDADSLDAFTENQKLMITWKPKEW
ncbi:MAG: hypothetical protein EOP53_01455 [Sphingobacteriales bacterium]|nr:MAG: hypothetical protein EOP53_01455 [Sphingobacteriales bacterium]